MPDIPSERRPIFTGLHCEPLEILRVQLYENLMRRTGEEGSYVWTPGGSGLASVLFYSPDRPDDDEEDDDPDANPDDQPDPAEAPDFDVAGDYKTGDQKIRVWDPLKIAFGFEDEKLWVKYSAENGRYEVLQPHGLRRRGRPSEDIAKGDDGAVEVFKGDTGTGVSVTAKDLFADVDSGDWTAFEWLPEEDRWDFYAKEC
jgi:hypothetical protein